MSEQGQKVVTLAQRRSRRRKKGSGSGGNDGDDRLRAVEESIVAIETELPHLATKADLKDLKIWWLCGILGGMVAAATIASLVVRMFSSS